jgi:rod shape-determining protein MreD
MKKIIFGFIIIACAILQTAFLNSFQIITVKPDLLLISVAIAAFNFDLKWVLIFGIFSGILKDALIINTFGINTLLFPFWGFLIIQISKKLSLENYYLRFALLIILVALNNVSLKSIFFILAKHIPWGVFLRVTFLECLYTALILPLLFKIARSLNYF